MKYYKKILISLLYIIASILILTLITTTLNYFNIINNKILNISKIIIPIFSFTLGGFVIGKNSVKNGWLEGLKLASFSIMFIFLINIILKYSINIKDLILYTLLVISTVLGSMFGINQKPQEK